MLTLVVDEDSSQQRLKEPEDHVRKEDLYMGSQPCLRKAIAWLENPMPLLGASKPLKSC